MCSHLVSVDASKEEVLSEDHETTGEGKHGTSLPEQRADFSQLQAGFFPQLAQGGFFQRLAWLDPTTRRHPYRLVRGVARMVGEMLEQEDTVEAIEQHDSAAQAPR
jgi:hypothetical protein